MTAPATTAPPSRLTPLDYNGPAPVGTKNIAVARKHSSGKGEEPNIDNGTDAE